MFLFLRIFLKETQTPFEHSCYFSLFSRLYYYWLRSCTADEYIFLGVNNEEKNEKKEEARLARKIAPRKTKECFWKTNLETNGLLNFKMQIVNPHLLYSEKWRYRN